MYKFIARVYVDFKILTHPNYVFGNEEFAFQTSYYFVICMYVCTHTLNLLWSLRLNF